MDISVSHIFATALGIVVGMVGWSLWQRRATLTPATTLQAVATIPALTKLMYDDALIWVQWLEQISKPASGEQQAKLTGAEKKRKALEVMQRRWPDADADTIGSVIEAAVYAAKHAGVQVPQIALTGEMDLLDRWIGEQDDSSAGATRGARG